MREHLFHCLWHYEFFQYDVCRDNGKPHTHGDGDDSKRIPSNCACISLEDFSKSIYIFLPVHKQKEFQDRFDKICKCAHGDGKVSYYEFIAFMWFIKDI